MMKRIKQFVVDHALTPPNAAATAEATAIDTAIVDIEARAEAQASGTGTISGAVDQRLLVVEELLNLMGSHQARGLTREAVELQGIAAAVNRLRAARRRAGT